MAVEQPRWSTSCCAALRTKQTHKHGHLVGQLLWPAIPSQRIDEPLPAANAQGGEVD